MRFDNDSHYSAKVRTVAAVMAATLVLVGACSGAGDQIPTGKVRVIATTSILGDVVNRLGGEAIDLEVMIPRGVDPHDFSPSAQQVAAISSADLVVANGLGLEEGLEDVLAQAESESIKVIKVGVEVDPLPAGANGDGHGSFDPHFWQDPIRMKRAVDMMSLWLVTAGVDEARDLTSAYQAEIDVTHAEVVALLAPIPGNRRLLVTNHDAFRYFAERYGFEIVGTIIPGGSTLAEPSSAEIAELVETIVTNDVPAIFVENIGSLGLADILAAETGTEVEVVQLVSDALGEPGSETDTYLGMLTYNASAIAAALDE